MVASILRTALTLHPLPYHHMPTRPHPLAGAGFLHASSLSSGYPSASTSRTYAWSFSAASSAFASSPVAVTPSVANPSSRSLRAYKTSMDGGARVVDARVHQTQWIVRVIEIGLEDLPQGPGSLREEFPEILAVSREGGARGGDVAVGAAGRDPKGAELVGVEAGLERGARGGGEGRRGGGEVQEEEVVVFAFRGVRRDVARDARGVAEVAGDGVQLGGGAVKRGAVLSQRAEGFTDASGAQRDRSEVRRARLERRREERERTGTQNAASANRPRRARLPRRAVTLATRRPRPSRQRYTNARRHLVRSPRPTRARRDDHRGSTPTR